MCTLSMLNKSIGDMEREQCPLHANGNAYLFEKAPKPSHVKIGNRVGPVLRN